MEHDTEKLIVTDENGKDIECNIILTFDSDEYEKSYVVYQIVGDESGEYYAASFNPDDGDEGKLFQVETDEEWDLIEEVLESFLEDQEDGDDEEEDEENEETDDESETDEE
ncbi:MAG TPA: DUF1292 domain-containing protein [Candidatus Izemoplasmatales bacterium]|nr:DUF1292 domain-containing protein [Bacillota bacterium]HRY78202.1 DUF1292 domain-containing protein [Candidatus Izemoplasmatales bacterium]